MQKQSDLPKTAPNEALNDCWYKTRKANTMKKFFSFDPDDGFETHDTEAEAKARALGAIDLCRDNAGDPDTGWPESVDGICWGEIRQRTVERDTTAETGQDFETCDYDLVNV